MSNRSSVEQWMAPRKSEERMKSFKGQESKRKGCLVAFRRESYLNYPCIVFSQEDGHPRVKEAYRC